MAITATLWQSVKKIRCVKMSYRCQCADIVQICRTVRDELELGHEDPDYLELQALACIALESAADDHPDVQSALERFRHAVDKLRNKGKGSKQLEKVMKRAESREMRDKAATVKRKHVVDGAQRRAIEAASRAASNFANKNTSAANTSPPCNRLVEFVVAPSLASLEPSPANVLDPLSLKHVARLNFSVNSAMSIPELVFRFQRKYRARGLHIHHIPLRDVRWPNFYSERSLHALEESIVHPLRNDELKDVLGGGTTNIWVYGDRSTGYYQLERPSPDLREPSLGRIRTRYVPGGDELSSCKIKMVYRDSLGYYLDLEGRLASDRHVFDPDFSRGRFTEMPTGTHARRIYLDNDRLNTGPIVPPPLPSAMSMPQAFQPGHMGSGGPAIESLSRPFTSPFASPCSMPMPQPDQTSHAAAQYSLPLDLPDPALSEVSAFISTPTATLVHTFVAPTPRVARPIDVPTTRAWANSRLATPLPIASSQPQRNDDEIASASSGSAYPISSAEGSHSPPRSPPPSSISSSSMSSSPPLPALTHASTSSLSEVLTDASEVMNPAPVASSLPIPPHTDIPGMPQPPQPTLEAVEASVWSRVKTLYTNVFNPTAQETEQRSRTLPGAFW